MKRLVLDLDGTLTYDEPSLAYEDKRPRLDVINRVREYKDIGFTIIIATARNMNWWFQVRSATRFRDWWNTSYGVLKPNLLRGRWLIRSWITLSSSAVTVDKGRFLGMYWRNKPLKFSFEPRCQLANGSAK